MELHDQAATTVEIVAVIPLDRLIAEETEKWAKVVKFSGAKLAQLSLLAPSGDDFGGVKA